MASNDWNTFLSDVHPTPVVEIASIPMAMRRLGWSRAKVQQRAVEDGVLFDASPLKLGRLRSAVPAAWVERIAGEQDITP